MKPSLLVRRIHMYAGLFLAPWMLMYALSTIAMNHRGFPPEEIVWEVEEERPYDVGFPEDTHRNDVAARILADLDLDGAHGVRGSLENRVTVWREDPFAMRRIVYDPSEKSLVISLRKSTTSRILEDLHRRRGFGKPYVAEIAWGVMVDVFIVAMLFWGLSGLWLWWELKATRLIGAACFGVGSLLFLAFVLTI